MTPPKIVVIGSSNIDMVIRLERLPDPGETVLGENFIMAQGGKGANQAVAAARLGADVTFITRVGDDLFGKQTIQNFQKEGINTEFIFKDEEKPTGVALIFVDKKGENIIAVASGANKELSKQDVTTAKQKIENADVMLLQLETPLATVSYAARMAFEAGVKVILNPAPARELDDSLLQTISVLTPNENEAKFLTGIKIENENSAKRSAAILRKKGVSNVVITMGVRGSFLASENKALLIPTSKVNTLDTTAAGDAFNGALAFSIANGDPLEKAVRFANMVGAFATTRLGAQPSLPTYNELREFIENEI